METYVVRITTVDNLYKDYIVEAKTLLEARNKAKDAFFRDYPDANEDICFSLQNPNKNNIKEIIMILNEQKNN